MACHMRIVSLNVRKRLNTTREVVEDWLHEWACDLFLVQEPWDQRSQPINLRGYKSLGGNSRVHSWLADGLDLPERTFLQRCWQNITFGRVAFYSVYLPAKSRAGRLTALRGLKREASQAKGKLLVILGDFNLAPEPDDGIHGEQISKWTVKAERTAFNSLLLDAHLVDMTSRSRAGHTEFTFQRESRGRQSAFRCDLALVSDILEPFATVRYDHRVRVAPTAFTDHSSIVVDVSINSLTGKEGELGIS